MTPALRHKTDPGIVFIDNDSAARVLHYGEDFLEEHLPVGTRVVYRAAPDPRVAEPAGGDPARAQPPPGLRSALRAASSRDAGHHRPRRHQPAAAADGDPRRSPDGAGDRAGNARRPRRGRRASRHRELAAPEDDRAGNAANGGAGHPQGVLPESLLQPRRRGSERHGRAGKDPPSRAGPGEPARDGERSHHLPEHQPGSHGRGPQIGDGRALRLREPEAPTTSRRRSGIPTATWTPPSRN